MNAIEARTILAKVSYRDWEPVLGYHNNGAFWLQWIWRRGAIEHRSPRWYVSNTLTRDELVGIAWQAVEAAELKCARQHFLYRDQPIFGDCDVDRLSDLHARLSGMETGEEKEDG